VTGSIIRPRIFISTSIEASLGYVTCSPTRLFGPALVTSTCT
jgi:hypothetical protein